MSEISNEQLKEIRGGATVSASFMNAIIKGIDVILGLGRSLGSAIRRIQDKNVCPY